MSKETAKNKKPAAASTAPAEKKDEAKKAEKPAATAKSNTKSVEASNTQNDEQDRAILESIFPSGAGIVPPESISFPKMEESMLVFWKRIQAFETSVKFSKDRPRYTFYDGPPFATGLPHYGHLLAGSIKDVMCRWAHQSGFQVERRFGWDCHGLPVEYEIDKKLNIRSPDDVLKMGIANYNAECRSIVSRYAKEWEQVVTRMARWIDFRNDYKTMYPWFMESVWWVFKELYKRGLVYRGVKVMPFSTACSTPLSNFESGQNYKDVTDPAVMISFPLEDDPKVALVAWTTTPWTLPSNLALCVNPDMIYVKVRDAKTGAIYILMEARLEALYKHHPAKEGQAQTEAAGKKGKAEEPEYAILERFEGRSLAGRRYVPLFNYFAEMRDRSGAFRVLTDTYVTSESGTGVVHQAPYFGEDDYRVCLRERIVTKEMKPICPVDEAGRFTAEVVEFAGQHVKDADKGLIELIKSRGRLVHRGTVNHSYPFCWRSDTPLIYKAVPSWFVRVESHSQELLSALEGTYWVPDFVKSKRFANWLSESRDWAISRSRFWGTPIPLWVSEDFEEIVCVGSIEELERLTGTRVTDLHRENIDHLTIKSSRPGKPDLRRVPEVFDCWFESGSMPYAQMHFPFDNQRLFLTEQFPADFIAEGIDQTRGWFYTLLVISTLLFGKAPFKNLIVNGIVLASDGQKMSKRLKNYPDPSEIINRFGADALRLYLVNSPAVRADNLRFKEEGVNEIVKQFFLPLYHSYRYLLQCVDRYQQDGATFTYDEAKPVKPSNFMDKWILSVIQSLLKFVKTEMQEYRLYTVLAKLVRFVEDLTNWYVKMNRKRLKGDGVSADDRFEALQTLFAVQLTMVRLLAPFTPFLTEFIYQGLRRFLVASAYRNPIELSVNNVTEKDSVHFLQLPEIRPDCIDERIESTVSAMQTVVELGRVIRERKTMPLKQPLREVVVICTDEQKLAYVREMDKYIRAELNVKRLVTTSRASDYRCTFKFDMDFKRLGQRFRKDRERVEQLVKAMTAEQVRQFTESGSITLDGRFELTAEDLRVSYTFENDASKQVDGAQDDSPLYEADSRGDVLVLVDYRTDAALLDEFSARKFLNVVQKLRKTHALQPTDAILIGLEASEAVHRIVTQTHAELVNATLKQPLHKMTDAQNEAKRLKWTPLGEDTTELNQDRVRVCLFGDAALQQRSAASSVKKAGAAAVAPVAVRGTSASAFRNVLVKSRDRTLHCVRLSENPKGRASPQFNPAAFIEELGIRNAECALAPDNEQATSFCRFANVALIDANGAEKSVGTVLLENPRGSHTFTSAAELQHFVARLFGLAKRPGEVELFEKDASGKLTALQLPDGNGDQFAIVLNGKSLVCKA